MLQNFVSLSYFHHRCTTDFIKGIQFGSSSNVSIYPTDQSLKTLCYNNLDLICSFDHPFLWNDRCPLKWLASITRFILESNYFLLFLLHLLITFLIWGTLTRSFQGTMNYINVYLCSVILDYEFEFVLEN